MTTTAKVLYWKYQDGSGFDVVRVYLENDFDQAQKDYDMVSACSTDRNWVLKDVDLYGAKSDEQIKQYILNKTESRRTT